MPFNPSPNPVVTCMAGFESWLLLFPLLGRFSGLMLQFCAANTGCDPVVTSLAGFAGRRPQATGYPYSNAGRFQVRASGFSTHTGRLLYPPQGPAQTP